MNMTVGQAAILGGLGVSMGVASGMVAADAPHQENTTAGEKFALQVGLGAGIGLVGGALFGGLARSTPSMLRIMGGAIGAGAVVGAIGGATHVAMT